MNPISIHEDVGSIPGLTQWVEGSNVAVSWGADCRHGSDPMLLWLWCRPAATALIQPLARELPYAPDVGKKRKERKRKEKKREKKRKEKKTKRSPRSPDKWV